MPLPTVIKTWQRNINRTVTAQGTNQLCAAQVFLNLKNDMKGYASGAWSVIGSSNCGGSVGTPTGTEGMDGVDRWSVQSDVTGNPPSSGGGHTWFVLGQPGIATNFQVCWDLASPGSTTSMVYVVSPSVGFSGGGRSARPTASDEIVLWSGPSTWFSAGNLQTQSNNWGSTDGQCFRFNMLYSSTTENVFWLHDVPNQAPSGWTHPSVSAFMFSGTGGFATGYSSSPLNGLFVGNAATFFNVLMGGESNGGTIFPNLTGVGNVANDFSAQWPLFGISLSCVTSLHKGRCGTLYDLWWRPNGVNHGDTAPNNATTRQFACLGVLTHTWAGGSTAPLIA